MGAASFQVLARAADAGVGEEVSRLQLSATGRHPSGYVDSTTECPDPR